MKRELVLSKQFEKSYKKFTAKNQGLKTSIAKALLRLQDDAYHSSLRTHKLSGKLIAYLACSCGYDCRIIFSLEKNINDPSSEVIVLLNIGTHDDVY